jgi:hypothetical protein
MIRQGLLCRNCSDKECRDIGSDQEPIEIECPQCRGQGCSECNQGSVAVQGCPNQYCRSMIDVVGLCDLYERGLPPIAGGALDQAAWFLEAANRLKHEEQTLKAEAGISD